MAALFRSVTSTALYRDADCTVAGSRLCAFHRARSPDVASASRLPASFPGSADEAGVTGNFIAPHEVRLMEAFSLGRTIRILAVLDGLILLLNCASFYILYVLVIWVSTLPPLAIFAVSSCFPSWPRLQRQQTDVCLKRTTFPLIFDGNMEAFLQVVRARVRPVLVRAPKK